MLGSNAENAEDPGEYAKVEAAPPGIDDTTEEPKLNDLGTVTVEESPPVSEVEESPPKTTVEESPIRTTVDESPLESAVEEGSLGTTIEETPLENQGPQTTGGSDAANAGSSPHVDTLPKPDGKTKPSARRPNAKPTTRPVVSKTTASSKTLPTTGQIDSKTGSKRVSTRGSVSPPVQSVRKVSAVAAKDPAKTAPTSKSVAHWSVPITSKKPEREPLSRRLTHPSSTSEKSSPTTGSRKEASSRGTSAVRSATPSASPTSTARTTASSSSVLSRKATSSVGTKPVVSQPSTTSGLRSVSSPISKRTSTVNSTGPSASTVAKKTPVATSKVKVQTAATQATPISKSDDALRKLGETEKELAALKEENMRLVEGKMELITLKAENERIPDLEEQVKVLRNDLGRIAILEATIATLEQENSNLMRLQTQLEDLKQMNSKIGPLEEEVNSLRQKNAALSVVADELVNVEKTTAREIEQLKEENARLSDLEKDVIELNAENTKLSLLPKEIERLTEVVNALKKNREEDAVKDPHIEGESRARELEEKDRRLAALEQELFERQAYIHELEEDNAKLAALQQQLAETKLDNDRLNAEISRYDVNLLVALKQNVAELREENTELLETIEMLKSKLSNAPTGADNAEAASSKLHEDNAEMQETIVMMQAKLDAASMGVETAKAASSQLREENAELQATIEAMKAKLETASIEADGVSSQLQKENAELQATIEAMKASTETDDANSQLRKDNAELQEAVQIMNEKLEAATRAVEVAESVNAEVLVKLATAEGIIADFPSKIAEVEANSSNLVANQLRAVSLQLTDAESKLEAVSQQLAEEKDKSAMLADSLLEAEGNITTLKDALHEAEKTAEDLATRLASVESKAEAVSTKLAAEEANVSSLTQKLEESQLGTSHLADQLETARKECIRLTRELRNSEDERTTFSRMMGAVEEEKMALATQIVETEKSQQSTTGDRTFDSATETNDLIALAADVASEGRDLLDVLAQDQEFGIPRPTLPEVADEEKSTQESAVTETPETTITSEANQPSTSFAQHSSQSDLGSPAQHAPDITPPIIPVEGTEEIAEMQMVEDEYIAEMQTREQDYAASRRPHDSGFSFETHTNESDVVDHTIDEINSELSESAVRLSTQMPEVLREKSVLDPVYEIVEGAESALSEWAAMSQTVEEPLGENTTDDANKDEPSSMSTIGVEFSAGKEGHVDDADVADTAENLSEGHEGDSAASGEEQCFKEVEKAKGPEDFGANEVDKSDAGCTGIPDSGPTTDSSDGEQQPGADETLAMDGLEPQRSRLNLNEPHSGSTEEMSTKTELSDIEPDLGDRRAGDSGADVEDDTERPDHGPATTLQTEAHVASERPKNEGEGEDSNGISGSVGHEDEAYLGSDATTESSPRSIDGSFMDEQPPENLMSPSYSMDVDLQCDKDNADIMDARPPVVEEAVPTANVPSLMDASADEQNAPQGAQPGEEAFSDQTASGSEGAIELQAETGHSYLDKLLSGYFGDNSTIEGGDPSDPAHERQLKSVAKTLAWDAVADALEELQIEAHIKSATETEEVN
ncbi:uncharacterized protein SPPG_04341 [Spizellomyces punctatus DAOM BR117]|uniref:Uncharacterized protein n=1 Tax=Spizellomyces punctatus (strain DAOM BR117) TaxID=645134 RepID=A0A0L0HG32_SPIPD|nr:uncharacterized protein SPPG_04341 [Spizellomyces punctatus DAOM BR117]KNC99991.1 hypothetical protein SPPG_04341 [Spizellomyces punctatus DAOM BR117]|eukprot:XP_016608031.1 hypothetical protein SPPG_04341 [Spizellomyces punctatus DAOM BR117]